MVSGAVIIGRPIGPEMTRPFTLNDFGDLQEICGLNLFARGATEVAYPYSFEEGNAYQEGVLVNVDGGDKSEKGFRAYVEVRVIAAAKMAEELWNDHQMRGIRRPWNSDLCSSKVAATDIGEGPGVIWKPYIEILKTYPSGGDAKAEYLTIASDLIMKTKEARIKRNLEQQTAWASDRINFISQENFR